MTDQINPAELDVPADDTVGGFPLNRLVAILAPVISTLAGAVATWLLTHVHFLAIFHFGHDQTAYAVSQMLIFSVVAIVTYAAHHKWLTGWQQWEAILAKTNLLGALPVGALDSGDAISGPEPTGAITDKPLQDS